MPVSRSFPCAWALALVALIAGCGRSGPATESAKAASPVTEQGATPLPPADPATAAAPAPTLAPLPAPASPVVPPEAASPSAAPPAEPPEPLDEGRMRVQPRKKASRLELDLDGDGKPETMRLQQTPARQDWVGEPEKGPRFRLQVIAAGGGAVLLEHGRAGFATGWLRLPVRMGGGKHGVFFQFSRPDDSTPRTLLFRHDGTRVVMEELDKLPIAHWDLLGNGVEAIHSISDELWQDFLRTGTSTLTGWQPAGADERLPFAAFEVCVANPEVAKPAPDAPAAAAGAPAPVLDLFAVERTGKRLHLLRPEGSGRLRSLATVAVTPPDDGSRWSAPSGFALSCLGGHAVQYKDVRYRFKSGKIIREAQPR